MNTIEIMREIVSGSSTTIYLSKENLSKPLYIKSIFGLLASGNAKENLRIVFPNEINDTVQVLTTMVKSLLKPGLPNGLALDFRFSKIGDACVRILTKLIRSKFVPKRLQLNLQQNNLTSACAKVLGNAICATNSPEGLCINLTNNNLGDEGLSLIADAIYRYCAPDGLELNFSANGITGNGIVMLAGALGLGQEETGKRPKNLTIDLSRNNLKNEGINYLFSGLSLINDKHKLTLMLSHNDMTTACISSQIYAISQGQYPLNLNIPDEPNFQAALDEYRLKRSYESKKLAAQLMELNHERKILQNNQTIDYAKGLPGEMIGYIAEYLNPSIGYNVGFNTSHFFHVHSQRQKSLPELNIMPDQVASHLNLNDIGNTTSQVLERYHHDRTESLKCRNAKVEKFISALKHIDSQDNQTFVSSEISRCRQGS